MHACKHMSHAAATRPTSMISTIILSLFSLLIIAPKGSASPEGSTYSPLRRLLPAASSTFMKASNSRQEMHLQ